MLLLAKNMLIPTHPRRKIKVDEEEGSNLLFCNLAERRHPAINK